MSQLPRVKYQDKTYYYDRKLGQLRSVDDPSEKFITLVGEIKDKFYMSTPDIWVHYPYLPIKRVISKDFVEKNPKFFDSNPKVFGREEMGVMTEPSSSRKISIRVYKTVIFMMTDLSKTSYYEYKSIDEVLADGWVVD